MIFDQRKNDKLNEDDLQWLDEQLGFIKELSPEITEYVEKGVKQDFLNIFEFNDKYLKYELFPRQKTALKIIYGIDLNEEDKKEIEWLWENKKLKIKWKPEGYNEIVFVMGRKSGKSAFSAGIIACYEIYRIHRIHDPQNYFNFLPNSPISVVLCSASGAQAEEMHLYLEAALKNCSYFDDYIDNYGKKDISIFTKKEKLESNVREGSIKVHTLHSLSRTVRTYNAFCILMDELAHMIDNNGVFSGDSLYKALTPSLSLFKNWGRAISLSSPLAKSGKLYDLYQLSQDENIKNIVAFQYATWEYNPNTKKEDFAEEFIKDPESADMEYGGNFGTSVNAYFPQDKVDLIFKKDRQRTSVGNLRTDYVVAVDPSKNGDRYAICVCHKEIRQIQGVPVTFKIIDLLKYFEAETVKLDNGEYKKLDIRIKDVEDFILELPKRGFRIGVIAYDQFNSTSSIQKFQDLNLNAKETTFTNKYKERIYSDLRNDLINEIVECYGEEPHKEGTLSSVGYAKAELTVLERTIKGKTVHIGHPKIGPIQTDDFADAIANGMHLLTNEKIMSGIAQRASKPIIARSNFG